MKKMFYSLILICVTGLLSVSCGYDNIQSMNVESNTNQTTYDIKNDVGEITESQNSGNGTDNTLIIDWSQKNKQYTDDGLLIVDYVDYPELFVMPDGGQPEEIKLRPERQSIYGTIIILEDGTNIKIEDFDPEAVQRVVGAEVESYEYTKEDCSICFLTGYINEQYVVRVPDVYHEYKIASFNILTGDDNLTQLYFEGDVPNVYISGCPCLKKIDFGYENTYRIIVKNCPNVESINGTEGFYVKSLMGVGENSVDFENIDLPVSIVMQNCMNNADFKTCSIKEGTKVIMGCFNDCENLESVVVPESVIFISDDCFNDCPEVTLYVAEGSVGEKYAVDKGLTYQYY